MIEFKEYVNILGTNYKIEKHKTCDDVILQGGVAGYCSGINKLIVVVDMEHESFISDMNEEFEKDIYMKEVMRHEILHAFLYESGLSDNSFIQEAWAKK